MKLLLSKGASCNAQTSDEHREQVFTLLQLGPFGLCSCVVENGARTDVKDARVSALDMRNRGTIDNCSMIKSESARVLK